VGTALAGALRRGGVPVLGLWARKPQAARSASAVSGVASYSAAPPDLLLECDVVILAVRDEAIAEVAEMLLNTGLITRRHVMLHCSGVLSSAEALATVRDRLGGVGTLHPLRAIADGRKGMHALRGTVFGVEGDHRGAAVATALARALGGTPLLLSSTQMAAYHTAAAMASNFVVALLAAAAELLATAGIAEEDATAALLPLAQGSLDNVGEHGLASGLTGPIRRGDVATVERHMNLLAGLGDLADLYRVLGRRALALARRAGDAAEADLDAIARLLGREHGDKHSSAKGGEETDIESRAYPA
jgi:predicted short-subunit dehydrogenase-like oxidoreductase (DUF2520 family)